MMCGKKLNHWDWFRCRILTFWGNELFMQDISKIYQYIIISLSYVKIYLISYIKILCAEFCCTYAWSNYPGKQLSPNSQGHREAGNCQEFAGAETQRSSKKEIVQHMKFDWWFKLILFSILTLGCFFFFFNCRTPLPCPENQSSSASGEHLWNGKVGQQAFLFPGMLAWWVFKPLWVCNGHHFCHLSI